ncbi:MAG: hypothetical protein WCI74_02600, partial [Actinomycetes bacterium]
VAAAHGVGRVRRLPAPGFGFTLTEPGGAARPGATPITQTVADPGICLFMRNNAGHSNRFLLPSEPT